MLAEFSYSALWLGRTNGIESEADGPKMRDLVEEMVEQQIQRL